MRSIARIKKASLSQMIIKDVTRLLFQSHIEKCGLLFKTDITKTVNLWSIRVQKNRRMTNMDLLEKIIGLRGNYLRRILAQVTS